MAITEMTLQIVFRNYICHTVKSGKEKRGLWLVKECIWNPGSGKVQSWLKLKKSNINVIFSIALVFKFFFQS